MQTATRKFYITAILVTLLCHLCAAQAQTVVISTAVVAPVNPYIIQSFASSENSIHVILNSPQSDIDVTLYGTISRISPTPLTIQADSSDITATPIRLIQGIPAFLSNKDLLAAFANFNIDLPPGLRDSLQEGNNYKLPEGIYNICFYARDVSGAQVSNTSCATFYVCNVTAPQFTQPVNNLILSPNLTIIQPSSPVIFSWLPPQSSCGLPTGLFVYNLELREIFDGQTITDALNNPFILRKNALTVSNFLLDTTLYQNVLHPGRKYIMQVQARPIGNTLQATIENTGYSRVEAFQYGGNISLIGSGELYDYIPPPDSLFVPFEQRQVEVLNEINESGGDTAVPLEQYIPYALAKAGISYNPSAIELFLTLNKELIPKKSVKLSYKPRLPEFPEVPPEEKEKFDVNYRNTLKIDTAEYTKFIQYANEIEVLQPNVPGNAVEPVTQLVNYLNDFKPAAATFSGGLLRYINEALAELLYEMRRYSNSLSKAESDRLVALVAAVKDLGSTPSAGTSYLNGDVSVQSFAAGAAQNIPFSFSSAVYVYSGEDNSFREVDEQFVPPAGDGKLIPFNVIVWRNSKEQPLRPVTNSPDLVGTYRISYILAALYNHKNPEIGSHSSNELASTMQYALPGNAVLTFWSRNMLTGKVSNPETVDLRDLLINNQKKGTNAKLASVVLKVE